ncbi:MAG: TraR/DksA family transcriptional regulator [Vicinamibacterales bacterium]
MDTERYKTRLLELERDLEGKVSRRRERARTDGVDSVQDTGDRSLTDETQSEDYTEAEVESARLGQVRDALQRIDAGTYGTCAVDGERISDKRLEAVPWAQYCLKHEEERQEGGGVRDTPTL